MKRVVLLFMCLALITLVGCKKDENYYDYEAIYVSINDKYTNNVYTNIDKSFKNYNYKKLYVVNKEMADNTIINLKILFVIDDNIDEFITNLKNDPKISSYEICKDIPFESNDERFFEYESSTIKVGDSLKIDLAGKDNRYKERFPFDSFRVIPVNYKNNTDYSKLYSKKANNISYVLENNNDLLIVLNTSDYYELIKTMDKFARSNKIQFVDFNYLNVIHPIWEVNNNELVEIVEEDYKSITIKALMPGTVRIKFDGIECYIEIKDK